MTYEEAVALVAKACECAPDELAVCGEAQLARCEGSAVCDEVKRRMAQPSPMPVSTDPAQEKKLRGILDRGRAAPAAQYEATPQPADVYSSIGAKLFPEKRVLILPTDAASRNEYPMFDGLFGYFPNALAEIARLSKIANEQHNPGEPMHWAIGKSPDHANKIVKHLLDHGHPDTDGTRHSTKVAWRALALLEEELVAAGAPRGRNAY